jgi:hypothetical protein
MTTPPAMSNVGHAVNTAPVVVPKDRKRHSVGSQIFLIIVFSILAGSHLERALLRHLAPRQPYEWTEDLIVGVGFLIGVVAFALRLRREATLKPTGD